jgi:site-specific recombinase XerD
VCASPPDHAEDSSACLGVPVVSRVAKTAGIGHVHPHQLRHTLATQAIDGGMRLEAIAALGNG